jgi:serine/threonine-protein kinase
MRVCTSCRTLLKADAHHCPADGAAAEIVETLPRDTRLAGYRIDRVLGEGGMGLVYEATHEVLNRRSAIKMLRPELASQAAIVTRFLNEAKAVNLIDHQNIVNVYDYGDSQDGSVYFVMEFLEGQTLDDLMRQRGAMALPLVLHLFSQIGRALAAAHAKQIVHRDLKPANVYVVAREHNPYFIKLLDFGIAQLRGHGAQGLTLAGSVMGTPQYMSPEQITGLAVDARSDVWAMGVMLYRAVTGQAPFKGEQFAELADKILHHPPQPASELVAMPAALAALIASCLERRIEARCPSLVELLRGLDAAKRELGLDDDAVLTAVSADAGAITGVALPGPGERTRDSLAGSLPRYQGAAGRAIQPGGAVDRAAHPAAHPAAHRAAPPARSRARWLALVALVIAVVAIGAAGYARLGRAGSAQRDGSPIERAGSDPPGSAQARARAVPTGAAALTATTGSLEALVVAGDLVHARERALADLRDAIATGTLQRQGFAVDAIGRAHARAAAPLLYAALSGSPELRVKAAHALGELALPDAVPRLVAALGQSGDQVKIELAAVMFGLGYQDARAMLERATRDPRTRLTAAVALAQAADPSGQAVLSELVQAMSPGTTSWRRAAGGLLQLGDATAREALRGELAQPDAARSFAAAELLARTGNGQARELLARAAADPGHARRGDAALALARLGDPRALDWVADGLASPEADERRAALEIAGRLAAAAAHRQAIAGLATRDPDPGVRLTAEAVVLGL